MSIHHLLQGHGLFTLTSYLLHCNDRRLLATLLRCVGLLARHTLSPLRLWRLLGGGVAGLLRSGLLLEAWLANMLGLL